MKTIWSAKQIQTQIEALGYTPTHLQLCVCLAQLLIICVFIEFQIIPLLAKRHPYVIIKTRRVKKSHLAFHICSIYRNKDFLDTMTDYEN